MTKDDIVGLLRDNDKLVAAIVGAVFAACVVGPVAFTIGSFNHSVEHRISSIEGQVKILNDRYVSMAERGELPASIERRLSEIERSLARIENRLDRTHRTPESPAYGRTLTQ